MGRAESATIRGRVVDEAGAAVTLFRVFAEDLAVGPDCCQTFEGDISHGQGDFAVEVPAGVYVLTALPPPGSNPARKRLDASGADVSGLELVVAAGAFAFVPDEPPRAELIEVSSADDDGRTIVSGRAGATGPLHDVILVVLETGHAAIAKASADGSFEATMFAPAGTSILVKSDPLGLFSRDVAVEILQGGEGAPGLLSGTIVHVPEPSAAEGIPFGSAGYMPNLFRLEGSIAKSRYQQGETLPAEVTLSIESEGFDAVGEVRASAHLKLERVSGPDGAASQLRNFFQSAFLTPTDLAFERGSFGDGQDLLGFAAFELPDTTPRRATGSFRLASDNVGLCESP